MGIKEIRKKSPEYPDNLKNIFNSPEALFVNGEILPSDNNAIALVGTRTPTYYGLEECERLAYDLALAGITVVSGMARGIDSAAHRGALKALGRTIAVLGSGHNNIYPPENRKLYGEIAARGAVVSEFPPDTPPLKMNFPRRNRIISGLAKGVVVVEAARRSGALITANFALEQGREVFAMPGNINSARSGGTNALIKEGAKLVQNADDIFEELKYVIKIEQIDGKRAEDQRPKTEDPAFFSDEKAIFDALDGEPKSVDEISRMANLPVHKVSQVLLGMELKKLIRMLPGENFVRT